MNEQNTGLTRLDDGQKSELIKSIIMNGDISKLSPEAKTKYFIDLCNSLGLDPITRPFDAIKFQGKEILYANKGCAEQLRNNFKISIEIAETKIMNGIYIVKAKATRPDGRTDESISAINIEGIKGDALANALMKGETKAKRRVTLSMCGLNMLDESELDTIGSGFGKLTQEASAKQEKQVVALPRPNENIDRVPDFFIEKVPAFKQVAGILFKDMNHVELMLVMDLAIEWSAKGKNPEAVALLKKVHDIASEELNQREQNQVQEAEYEDVA